jgi:hypothetical protein
VNSPLLLPPHNARACKIVTFYEDFASAMRAYRVFEWLARNFSGDLPVKATSWSFSMLGMSRLTSTVLRDSASADVLVVSANGDKDLPPHVAAWIEDCISRERNAGPVLVALLDDEFEEDGSTAILCSSLERIANREGARFLRNRDLKERMHCDLSVEPARNGSGNPVRARDTAPYSIVTTHRWGIND